MMIKFSTEGKKKFDQEISRHPERQAALLPVLALAQEEFKYLSPEVLECIATLMDIPPSTVSRTASFYTMFNEKPVGKYHIQVCRNLSCSLLEAEKILEHIQDRLGLSVGQTSADSKFTLSTVECLGSCGTAPVIQINDRYYENLTIERVNEILDGLSNGD